jgi:hypothetical protein
MSDGSASSNAHDSSIKKSECNYVCKCFASNYLIGCKMHIHHAKRCVLQNEEVSISFQTFRTFPRNSFVAWRQLRYEYCYPNARCNLHLCSSAQYSCIISMAIHTTIQLDVASLNLENHVTPTTNDAAYSRSTTFLPFSVKYSRCRLQRFPGDSTMFPLTLHTEAACALKSRQNMLMAAGRTNDPATSL